MHPLIYVWEGKCVGAVACCIKTKALQGAFAFERACMVWYGTSVHRRRPNDRPQMKTPKRKQRDPPTWLTHDKTEPTTNAIPLVVNRPPLPSPKTHKRKPHHHNVYKCPIACPTHENHSTRPHPTLYLRHQAPALGGELGDGVCRRHLPVRFSLHIYIYMYIYTHVCVCINL